MISGAFQNCSRSLFSTRVPDLLQPPELRDRRPASGVHGNDRRFFYHCPNAWFGSGKDCQTSMTKVLVDQFTLQDWHLSRAVASSLVSLDCLTEKVLPIQIPGLGFVVQKIVSKLPM